MSKGGNPNWKKGVSGNPGGRPKDTMQEFLRGKEKLPQEIYDAIHPLLKSRSEKMRLAAGEFLRDTRDGKPAQAIQHSGLDDGPIKFEITQFNNGQPWKKS